MADTGKPLPIATRLEVKQRRMGGETVRAVAQSLGLSKTTVQKYWNKRGTKLLNESKESVFIPITT